MHFSPQSDDIRVAATVVIRPILLLCLLDGAGFRHVCLRWLESRPINLFNSLGQSVGYYVREQWRYLGPVTEGERQVRNRDKRTGTYNSLQLHAVQRSLVVHRRTGLAVVAVS